VQLSATSHAPADSRQVVVGARNPSAGHAALDPVQVSAASQTPADGRQTVVGAAKVSAGQAALVPVQLSATSHAPAEVRQISVAGLNTSAGQSLLIPSQTSAASQRSAETRQTVPLGARFVWQTPAALQVSAKSHAPAASPHTVPTLTGVETQTATSVPLLFCTSQLSAVQTLLSLQIVVAQGFNCGVTTRSVQSHFDPVPAC
jgi:hypothetical protein